MDYNEKEQFIYAELEALVIAIAADVVELEYINQGDEEFCIVYFEKSDPRQVNITGDSLLAVTKDVLKIFE